MGEKTPQQVFTCIKPDVGHLRIFGFPVYFHVLKDKRNKMENTRNKGMLFWYCDNSKYFRIYVCGQRNIKFSRDVTFNEDVSLGKERYIPPPLEKKDGDIDVPEGPYEPELEKGVFDDPVEPMDPLDPSPCDPLARKTIWLHDTLQDFEQHVTAKGTFRESKKPCKYQGYVVDMSPIIQVEHRTFEETMKEKVWKDAMAEKYESIMKNNVWEVVPRPKGKSLMTSN